jgi:hypothetical protein
MLEGGEAENLQSDQGYKIAVTVTSFIDSSAATATLQFSSPAAFSKLSFRISAGGRAGSMKAATRHQNGSIETNTVAMTGCTNNIIVEAGSPSKFYRVSARRTFCRRCDKRLRMGSTPIVGIGAKAIALHQAICLGSEALAGYKFATKATFFAF